MIRSLITPPRLVQSAAWWRAFLAGVLLCAAAVVVDRVFGAPGGASAWTIAYGIAAAALLVAALAYSGRRRAPRRGPAALWHWVQLHVYGGTLFLLLLLMHSGGRLPTGTLAWGLWFASVWVVATGLVGVLIQKWAPAVLTSGLTTEVHYDRIPELVRAVREKVERLAATGGESVRTVYDTHLAPALAAPHARLIYFVDITGGVQSRMRRLDHARRLLQGEDAKRVEQIQALVRTKFEMDAHYTVQRALRWWLYAHAPAAIALVVLVLFHVFAVLRY